MIDVDFPDWQVPPDDRPPMTFAQYCEWVEAYWRSLPEAERRRLRDRPGPTGERFVWHDDG